MINNFDLFDCLKFNPQFNSHNTFRFKDIALVLSFTYDEYYDREIVINWVLQLKNGRIAFLKGSYFSTWEENSVAKSSLHDTALEAIMCNTTHVGTIRKRLIDCLGENTTEIGCERAEKEFNETEVKVQTVFGEEEEKIVELLKEFVEEEHKHCAKKIKTMEELSPTVSINHDKYYFFGGVEYAFRLVLEKIEELKKDN